MKQSRSSSPPGTIAENTTLHNSKHNTNADYFNIPHQSFNSPKAAKKQSIKARNPPCRKTKTPNPQPDSSTNHAHLLVYLPHPCIRKHPKSSILPHSPNQYPVPRELSHLALVPHPLTTHTKHQHLSKNKNKRGRRKRLEEE